MNTIGDIFQYHAERRSDHPALIDEKGILTYSVFASHIFNVGLAFGSLGFQRGDRVALLLPDIREYLIGDYGIMSGGFVRVPVDPSLPTHDIIALLRESGAHGMITDHARATGILRYLHDVPDGLPGLRHIVLATEEPDRQDLAGANGLLLWSWEGFLDQAKGHRASFPKETLATINFSGGTTGRPKGIALSHGNVCTVLRHTAASFEIQPDAIFLNMRPLWPVAQLVMMAYLARGTTVVLGGRFQPARFLDLIEKYQATDASLVPTQLFRLVPEIQPNDPRLASLRSIFIGGSRVAENLFKQALEIMGPKIGVLYGMTEAPISCVLLPKNIADSSGTSTSVIRSVGRPVPGCSIGLLKDERIFVGAEAEGVEGEIIIQGAHVMQGYWNDRHASDSAFFRGWLRTGDIGQFMDGLLFITGRLKEVIRSGASSVIPAEVEDVLLTHPDVLEACVIGLPDPEWGEAVTAFVVKGEGSALDEMALLSFARNKLASFKRPKRVIFLTVLPRSHYGKVLRAQLLDMQAQSK